MLRLRTYLVVGSPSLGGSLCTRGLAKGRGRARENPGEPGRALVGREALAQGPHYYSLFDIYSIVIISNLLKPFFL